MSETERETVTVLLVKEATADKEAEAHVLTGAGRICLPAERIASEAGLPVSELPGRKFSASRSAGGELYDFRLLNDPRI